MHGRKEGNLRCHDGSNFSVFSCVRENSYITVFFGDETGASAKPIKFTSDFLISTPSIMTFESLSFLF